MTNSIEGAMPPLPAKTRLYSLRNRDGDPMHIEGHTDEALQAYAAHLIARVAELQADAARYRWLCSHMIVPAPSLWDKGVGFVTQALPRKSGAMTKPELDAAIDAALTSNKEQQP